MSPILVFLISAGFWFNSPSKNLYSYLEALGARKRAYSRILGIASFELPEAALKSKKFKAYDTLFIPVAKGKVYEVERIKIPNYADNDFIYRVLGVDKLHEAGLYGQGITIGVFDTGFDSTHPAISPIFSEGRVVATYDFNSGDHVLYNGEYVPISDSLVYVNRVVLKDTFLILSYSSVDNLALNDNAYSLIVLMPHSSRVLSQNERSIEPDAVLKDDTLFVVSEVVDGGILQIKMFVILPDNMIHAKTITSSVSNKIFPSIFIVKDTIFVSFIDEGAGIRRVALLDTQVVKDDTIFIDGFLTYQKMTGDYLLFTTSDSIYLALHRGDSISYIFGKEGFYPAIDTVKKRVYFSTTSGFYYYDINQKDVHLISSHLLTSYPAIDDTGNVYVTLDDYGAYKVEDHGLSKIANGIFDEISISKDDFVLRQRGDRDVQPDTRDPYNMHGTEMLSIIGGFWEGKMVGISPMANFVLCKTERGYSPNGNNFENPVEEDFWVEALEYAHYYGARVISSSLGYRDWYKPEELNGEVPISSRIASRALSMGMIVVNAMGNADHSSIPSSGDTTLVAPADARDIIAVGGCDSTGTKPAICSYGPSGDGRIKPEVVAPFNAYYTDSSGATYWLGGTSVSTAIAAGIIASAWSAIPHLSAESMREFVLNTAVTLPGYASPNNITGYGRIDGKKLLNALNAEYKKSGDVVFLNPYPNPARKTDAVIHLPLKFAHRGDGVVKVYTINGEPVKVLNFENRGPGIIDLILNISNIPPGLYIALCHTGFGNARTRFVILPR